MVTDLHFARYLPQGWRATQVLTFHLKFEG